MGKLFVLAMVKPDPSGPDGCCPDSLSEAETCGKMARSYHDKPFTAVIHAGGLQALRTSSVFLHGHGTSSPIYVNPTAPQVVIDGVLTALGKTDSEPASVDAWLKGEILRQLQCLWHKEDTAVLVVLPPDLTAGIMAQLLALNSNGGLHCPPLGPCDLLVAHLKRSDDANVVGCIEQLLTVGSLRALQEAAVAAAPAAAVA
ncbi:MAG: hypothetical protein G01um101431_943 [Parcubacteria group bacterium Gr01-1014_31]|nr:MAG: hypothetical protein G01um101431_943 [Parcubacteria group bacterium Gr01-1014_31]